MFVAHQFSRILQIVEANQLLPAEQFYRNQHRRLVVTRQLTELIMISLLQYVSLRFAATDNLVPPVWLASGIAIGFTCLRGKRVALGLLLGSLFFFLQLKMNFWCAFWLSIVHVLEALLVRVIAFRAIGPVAPLVGKGCLRYFLLLFCVSALHSSVVFFIYSYLGYIEFSFALWGTAWLGNFSGALLFSFFLFSWNTYVPRKTKRKRIFFSYGTLVCLNLGMCFTISVYPLLLLLLGTLLCSGILTQYYAQRGASAAVLLSGVLFICLSGMPNFYRLQLEYPWLLLVFQLKLVFETMALYYWSSRSMLLS